MIRRAKRMKTSQIDAAMEMLRSAGRNGDTELAHVNPREKAILKALGGAGSRNPRTGLREYFADVDGGAGGGAQSEGSVSNVGSMGSDYSPGESDPSALGGFTGFGFAPTGSGSLGVGTENVSGSILGDLQQGSLPASPVALGAYGLAYGMGRALDALGVGGTARGSFASPTSNLTAFEGGPGGMPGNRAGGGDNLAMALGAVPVSAPTPRYLRGGEMAAPQEISSFIGPGMTDLQQRALISTYGTQGVNSAFRTDPVRRYYANLLSRGLISDRGTPVQNPYVLPIEQQYASMVLGRPMTNPSDAAAAYESIRELL